jgi:tetratricopeptide (TPR) repeat protein
LRVFRDDTSLSASPELWPAIQAALDRSRFFVLLSSREAARSDWVGKEVKHWLSCRSIETLLIVVTDGELVWRGEDFEWSDLCPLPEVLRGRFAGEPKWVDMRAFREAPQVRDTRMIDLAADIAAAIHGTPNEDLLSQELLQQRRALRLAWSAAASLLVLAIAAGVAGLVAKSQRDRAINAVTSGQIAQAFAFDMVLEGRPSLGFPIEMIDGILGRVRSMQRDLQAMPEMLPALQRLEAMVLRERATTLLFQGDVTRALEAAHSAAGIMQRLVEIDTLNEQWQRELSLSLNRVGEVLTLDGRHEEALDQFRLSLRLRRPLTTSFSDATRQRDIAISHERIGDALFELKQTSEARAEYEIALKIRRELLSSEPSSAPFRADLAVAYDRIGRTAPDAGVAEEVYPPLPCGLWDRTDEVALADSNSVVPQDGVGGGLVEEEVRQRKVQKIGLSAKGHRVAANGQRDLTFF